MKKITIVTLLLLAVCSGFAQSTTDTKPDLKKAVKKGDLFCTHTDANKTDGNAIARVSPVPEQPGQFVISYTYAFNDYWTALDMCFAHYSYVSAEHKTAKMDGRNGKCTLTMNLEGFSKDTYPKYNSALTVKEGANVRTLALSCSRVE